MILAIFARSKNSRSVIYSFTKLEAMNITIIDYGMGNLHSVVKALKHVGYQATVSGSEKDILMADKIILPGVGHFGTAMKNLKQQRLIGSLQQAVMVNNIPILGICLGMQLLHSFSEEGHCAGLDLIEGQIRKFPPAPPFDLSIYKVPHIGWNSLEILPAAKILSQNEDENYFYFVHSYFVDPQGHNHVASYSTYGYKFISSVQKNHIFGTQFHPEKSHEPGLNIIKKFVELPT